jgi:hypothetical protein
MDLNLAKLAGFVKQLGLVRARERIYNEGL